MTLSLAANLGAKPLGGRTTSCKIPIGPDTHAVLALVRLKVNVRRALFYRVKQHLVDKLDDRRIVSSFVKSVSSSSSSTSKSGM